MVCLPALEFRAFPGGALEVEQVVEKHDLAAADAELAFAEEQAVAAEAPALGDDHAFRAAFGNLDLRLDGVGPPRMFGAQLAGTPLNSPE